MPGIRFFAILPIRAPDTRTVPFMVLPTPGNRFTVSLLILVIALAGTTVVGFVAARHFYIVSKVVRVDLAPQSHRWILKAEGERPLPRPLLIIGDSRVEQWSERAQIGGRSVVTEGIPGETTSQLEARFEQSIVSLNPDVIVIGSGINDLLAASFVPGRASEIVSRAKFNLLNMVEVAHTHKIPVILMTVVPPSNPSLWRRIVWSDQIYNLVGMLNIEIKAMDAPPGVRVLDAAAVLGGTGDRIAPANAKDTLHFTAQAYDELNDALTLLLAPTPNAVQ